MLGEVMKKQSDFKSAFYISLAVFTVAAIIVGNIIVSTVRF